MKTIMPLVSTLVLSLNLFSQKVNKSPLLSEMSFSQATVKKILYLGEMTGGSNIQFYGWNDEFRISNTARSFKLSAISENISYNRYPICNVIYPVFDDGSTLTRRETSVRWSTYDVYLHDTESSTTITRHYDRHDKKTTEHVDSYLCALCGYNWDVDHADTEEHTVHYSFKPI